MSLKKVLMFVLVCAVVVVVSVGSRAQQSSPQPDRAQEILAQARQALGGDSAFQAVKSLSVSGDFLGTSQDRDINGEIKLDLLLPDMFMKSVTLKMGSGMSVTRVETVDGDQVWTDTKRSGGESRGRSGMGRGRMGGYGPWGGGGPIGGGGGPWGGGAPGGGGGRGSRGEGSGQPSRGSMGGMMGAFEDRDQIRADFSRLLVALFLSPPSSETLQFKFDHEEEADAGKADDLKVTGSKGPLMDLLIDQKTHRPVMISYQAAAPRSFSSSRTQSRQGDDEDTGSAPEKQLSTYQIYFSDYQAVSEKGVGEIYLPSRIAKMVGDHTQEEWIIKKFKLNSDLKPKKFEKKD